MQAEILDAAAQCVKPGGVLVYSTCTVGSQEMCIRDRSADRVRMIEETAARLGLSSLETVCCDARELQRAYTGKADACLLYTSRCV